MPKMEMVKKAHLNPRAPDKNPTIGVPIWPKIGNL